MMSESELNLLTKWSETKDKEEFVRIGLQLSKETNRQELENLFEEAMSGYRETSAAKRKVQENIS